MRVRERACVRGSNNKMAEQLPDGRLQENLPSDGESEEEEEQSPGGKYHMKENKFNDEARGRRVRQFRNLKLQVCASFLINVHVLR